MTKRIEVEFGQKHEERIARRWLDAQTSVPDAKTIFKAPEFADYDFFVLDDYGRMLAYLEVKLRRKSLAVFGDVMFPRRKHEFALRAWGNHKLRFLAATEYAGGTLVEVDLKDEPSFSRDIRRSDRPNTKPVPHVFYKTPNFRIIANGVKMEDG